MNEDNREKTRHAAKYLIIIFLIWLTLGFSAVDYTNWLLRFTITNNAAESRIPRTTVEESAKVAIRALYYNCEGTVGDYLQKNDSILRHFLRQPLKIIQTDMRFLSDGLVICEYETPLVGELLRLLIPPRQSVNYLVPMLCPCCRQPWPENLAISEGIKLIPSVPESMPKYTGILIDARNISIGLALFPRIITEDGYEVFSVNFADPDYIASSGLVKYLSESSEVLLNELCGDNPLRITALASRGTNNVDIVISHKAGQMLHSSLANLELLEKCRVVVLYRD
ncbi:MAG: hypothetical protein ABIK10_03035 [candidate division WOR-3 bacterium]